MLRGFPYALLPKDIVSNVFPLPSQLAGLLSRISSHYSEPRRLDVQYDSRSAQAEPSNLERDRTKPGCFQHIDARCLRIHLITEVVRIKSLTQLFDPSCRNADCDGRYGPKPRRAARKEPAVCGSRV